MTTSKVESSQVGWNLWFRWIGAHIVSAILIAITAFLLAGPVFIWLMGGVSTESGEFSVAVGAAGALALGIIGTLQWSVLRAPLLLTKRWIVASVIGGTLVGLLASILWVMIVSESVTVRKAIPPIAIVSFAAPFAALFIIGALQWLVMRQHLARSAWWVLASIASGLPGNALSLLLPLPDVWIIASILIVYPCMTGIALIWLLRRSTANYDGQSKVWVVGGSFVVVLSLMALYWGKSNLPRYVDRSNFMAMPYVFAEALQKNQGEFAKSLAAPEQWNRIDRWVANHPPYKCQLQEWLDRPRDGDAIKDIDMHYICFGSDPDIYSFSVFGIALKQSSDVWVVVRWKKICETRNGQEVCQ